MSADTALWWFATRTLAAETDGWMTRVEDQGWVVSAGSRVRSGWPFAAALTLDRASVSGGGRLLPGGLTWSADRVVLSVSLRHPLTLTVSPEGQQFFRLSHLPDLGFTAARAVAHIPLLAGYGVTGDIQVQAIMGGIAGSRHPQDVQVAMLSMRLQDGPHHPDASVRQSRITLRATGIGLPDIGRWPLGATIARAGATLTMTSPTAEDKPTTAIRSQSGAGQSRAAAQATVWRDGGGTLLVREAELRWGPLGLNASADLHLDGRLQPAGSGTADVTGAAPALDDVVQGGLVAAGVALTAKAVLAVMPRGPDGTAVRLPFMLRDNTLSVGAIPVARLGEIGWERLHP